MSYFTLGDGITELLPGFKGLAERMALYKMGDLLAYWTDVCCREHTALTGVFPSLRDHGQERYAGQSLSQNRVPHSLSQLDPLHSLTPLLK